jgi:hypothetical protein
MLSRKLISKLTFLNMEINKKETGKELKAECQRLGLASYGTKKKICKRELLNP